jgi:hypothetical protein
MPALQYILSFLWFPKKADFSDERFFSVALENWKKRELLLSSIDWSSIRTEPLRRVASKLVRAPEGPLLFKHGPGRVAERGVSTLIQKNEWLRYHPLFEPILLSAQGTIYIKYALPAQLLRCVEPEYRVSDDIAWLIMVRKNYKTARSVCEEPTSFMYVQQGVMGLMVRSFKRSPIRRFVDLNDQSKTQEMVIQGSADQSLATLDLKDASDSVSDELVQAIFSDDWLLYLNCSRSSVVHLPDNSLVRVKKFAPMGSATCFPVQCWIFTSVGVLAYSLWYQGLGFEDFVRGCKVKIFIPPEGVLRIFGDDIVVREELVDLYIALLQYYGFTVNVDKSFRGGSSIREGCGVYACDGVVITPDIFKTKDLASFEFRLSPLDIRISYSLIAMANIALQRGWLNLRAVLLQWIHPASFVFVDSDIPYARSPWCVHRYGEEKNHSSREIVVDRYHRPSVSLIRFATKGDPVFGFRMDDQGVIHHPNSSLVPPFEADNAYWYSVALAKMLGLRSRVSYAPLKDLNRRSFLVRSLTPVG